MGLQCSVSMNFFIEQLKVMLLINILRTIFIVDNLFLYNYLFIIKFMFHVKHCFPHIVKQLFFLLLCVICFYKFNNNLVLFLIFICFTWNQAYHLSFFCGKLFFLIFFLVYCIILLMQQYYFGTKSESEDSSFNNLYCVHLFLF